MHKFRYEVLWRRTSLQRYWPSGRDPVKDDIAWWSSVVVAVSIRDRTFVSLHQGHSTSISKSAQKILNTSDRQHCGPFAVRQNRHQRAFRRVNQTGLYFRTL